MEDQRKAKLLNEIANSQAFQAQVALEDETLSSWISRMTSIDLSDVNVALEFAKARGAIEALKSVKANRDRLVSLARSSQSNS